MTKILLSDNFTLAEMLKSSTAVRQGFVEQLTPPISVVKNLEALAKNILQPLRNAERTPILIISGYRCHRLNDFIGGSDNSQHVTGEAVDIESDDNEALFNMIQELGLPFDQLINEFNFAWVHVSFGPRNRRQILRAIKEKGKTKYLQI
jgi:hypothetical protein